ncbi:MAG: hypothetical protein ABIQ95_16695 [Bdellovibrionia bacterium]
MLKSCGLYKILLLSSTLLALSYGLASFGAHASSSKRLNHPSVSLQSLGSLGSHLKTTEGLSAAELAHLDLKLLSIPSKPRVAQPAFDLSLISVIKYGGIIVHF